MDVWRRFLKAVDRFHELLVSAYITPGDIHFKMLPAL